MAEPFAAISELVRQLYAGAVEAPPWQGFLECLRRDTGSKAALIMLAPGFPDCQSTERGRRAA